MITEFPKGTQAFARGQDDLVTVESVRSWPFPYGECRTAKGHLIPIPISSLTAVTWNFED